MMKLCKLFNLIVLITCVHSEDFYTGAVVEYEPLDSNDLPSPIEVMAYNADRYNQFIYRASTLDVDIIVFPEYGITGVTLSGEEDRERAKMFMVRGEVGVNYCDRETTDEVILKMISCSAKNSTIYVVFNTGEMVECETDCENEDMLSLYNTNFVFDREGTLIAKYWKQNLFMEPVFEVPKEHIFAYFETDFGVTFGTFICFDALWGESLSLMQRYPNITDIVYPTAWVDELPFLLAPLEQNGWAVGMNVNFLASGYHGPEIGALGSGIYSPSGPLNYTYYETSGSNMVTARVPKLNRNMESKGQKKIPKTEKDLTRNSEPNKLTQEYQNTAKIQPMNLMTHPMIYEDLSIYSHSIMMKGKPDVQTLCYNETFCCHASYSLTNLLPHISYHLLAYKGERGLAGEYTIDIELCGLVLCREDGCGTELVVEEEEESFQFLELSANYSNNTIVIPSVLDWSGQLPDWDKVEVYSAEWVQGKEVIMSMEHSALFSAALYARVM